MNRSFADEFLLDPELVYLNHAAYGACPRPVFESYQRWQRLLEREPVDFLSRYGEDRLAEARQALARYLGTERDDIVFVSNATCGINVVARSLRLGAGDEVMTTAHEHGGVARMWRFFAERCGFEYRAQATRLPLSTPDAYVEELWSGVRESTRVIILCHISSPTAITLPVREICRRAREAGIVTIIDGAHAPGQIPLDLTDVGADFYVGVLHKWVCAPKGTGFLYARPSAQELLDPLVVSWGWEPINPRPSRFVDLHEWWGTRDTSPFLAVPDAIEWISDPALKPALAECRSLTREACAEITARTGLEPFAPGTEEWYHQMAVLPLPSDVQAQSLRETLRHRHGIEISVDTWQGVPKIRVAFQVYNTRDHLERLLNALDELI